MRIKTLYTAVVALRLFLVAQAHVLGGADWNRTASHAHLKGSRCNINRVAWRELTPAAFQLHFSEQAPVILTGIDNSGFASLTRRARLLADYGHLTVTLSTANTISHDKIKLQLRSLLATLAPRSFPLPSHCKSQEYHSEPPSYWVSALFNYYLCQGREELALSQNHCSRPCLVSGRVQDHRTHLSP